MSLKVSFGELAGLISFKEAEEIKAKTEKERQENIRLEMEEEIRKAHIDLGICEECNYTIGHSPVCSLTEEHLRIYLD